MDPIKQITEHHIVVSEQQQQHKENTEQTLIRLQVHLADILLFGGGRLTPEQQQLQETLQKEYLCSLKSGDTVEVGLQGMMNFHSGIVISNDGQIVKIKASCYLNKKKKEGIRSFSTKDGNSRGFIINKDDRFDETTIQRFFIVIPVSYTVKSTAGIPQKALDEITEIYKQAGDEKTCYDLVNVLKYGKPKASNDLTF